MGLMDVFGKKSPLVDTGKYLSNVPGKLLGPAKLLPEGDFLVAFMPDDKKWLMNRDGKPNPNGLLELKVHVPESQAKAFLDAVQPFLGQAVHVCGVLAEDESQGSKTQVQPLDLIWGTLPIAHYPDWIKNIWGSLEYPDAAVVYRALAASDASKAGQASPCGPGEDL